ncbi:MAG: flagellar export chaperone FliS [Rickettsiales bacterium]
MQHRNQLKAYSKATHTVSKTRQVVMLYDGVIRFLQQAHDAMAQKEIEKRYHLLVKASNIILGLQSCLDFTQDKTIAQTLYDFYSSIDARILKLHRSNDLSACTQIINELKEMRGIWSAVDNGELNQPPAQEAPAEAEGASEAPATEAQNTTQPPNNPLGGVAVSA